MMKKITLGIGFFTALAVSTVFLLNRSENDAELIRLINQEILEAAPSSGKSAFNLLDATQFTDSMYPWLGYPVLIISETSLPVFPESESMSLDELRIKEALIKFKDQKRIILNIASWQITSNDENEDLMMLHVHRYLQLIRWAKEVLPETDIGVFGIPYTPWLAIKSPNPLEMLHYQHLTKIIEPLIEESDTLYPLFQVFSDKPADLSYLMGAQLYIAKMSGKPVYPIVSHRKMTNTDTLPEWLPVEVIRQQCLFVRGNADGMVWWSNENEVWRNDWYEAVADQCFS